VRRLMAFYTLSSKGNTELASLGWPTGERVGVSVNLLHEFGRFSLPN
jgi:hypothetical protein